MVTSHGFVSRQAELEFILTKLDGYARMDLLGAKRIHYVSKQHANEWYSSLVEETSLCSDTAKENLKIIYGIMVHGR